MTRRLRRTLVVCAILGGLGAVALTIEPVLESVDRARFPPPGRLIPVEGTRRLHLWCSGMGPVSVILEASGLGTALSYQRVVALLSPTTRVCAYDRAGMGWSDPATGPQDAAAIEHDLWRLLHAAAVPPPYLLVAASAGGLDAELLARRHSETVVGMVFLDALDGPAIEPLRSSLDRLRTVTCGAAVAARLGLLRLLNPFHFDGSSEGRVAAALTYQRSATAAACSLLRSVGDSQNELATAPPWPNTLPLRVLSHAEPRDFLPPGQEREAAALEPLWNAQQEALALRSLHGRREIVAGSGHLIAVDRPDAVAQAVLDLLPKR